MEPLLLLPADESAPPDTGAAIVEGDCPLPTTVEDEDGLADKVDPELLPVPTPEEPELPDEVKLPALPPPLDVFPPKLPAKVLPPLDGVELFKALGGASPVELVEPTVLELLLPPDDNKPLVTPELPVDVLLPELFALSEEVEFVDELAELPDDAVAEPLFELPPPENESAPPDTGAAVVEGDCPPPTTVDGEDGLVDTVESELLPAPALVELELPDEVMLPALLLPMNVFPPELPAELLPPVDGVEVFKAFAAPPEVVEPTGLELLLPPEDNEPLVTPGLPVDVLLPELSALFEDVEFVGELAELPDDAGAEPLLALPPDELELPAEVEPPKLPATADEPKPLPAGVGVTGGNTVEGGVGGGGGGTIVVPDEAAEVIFAVVFA